MMREIGYTKSEKLYDYPELMTCPFCGKMPSMVVNPHKKQEVFFVKCMNKKCGTQPFTDEYKDILKAAEKWNKRENAWNFVQREAAQDIANDADAGGLAPATAENFELMRG